MARAPRRILYVLCLTDSIVCGSYEDEGAAGVHLDRIERDGHTGTIAEGILYAQADDPRPPLAEPPSAAKCHNV